MSELRGAGWLHDDRVAAALTDVPRHAFLPGIDPGPAYQDDAVVTRVDAGGRPVSSSSQPAIMAIMLEQLAVRPGHRVPEIGAGTGYNAALLARLGQPAPPGRTAGAAAGAAGRGSSTRSPSSGAEDHLESVSVLPCGFIRLRGAFAGPETVSPVGDGTGVMAEAGPRPDGAEELADLLAQPGKNAGSGVQMTVRDACGGLGLWLAARLVLTWREAGLSPG